MSAVFADTFYFLALVNPRDQAHARALQLSTSSPLELVTTAWVLTEVADGLAARNRAVFNQLLKDLRSDLMTTIVEPTLRLFEDGITLYEGRLDKQWSLTDCISFVVMEQRGMTEALTGDHHFEQAGFSALLK
jgi:predicted nucleic acid-binding protein